MSDDVRMRGFRQRADVDEVTRLIDARVSPLAHEPVPLLEAAGRVLGMDAAAAVDVPPYARSAMDGYALRADETFGATPDDPRILRVLGEFDTQKDAAKVLRISTRAINYQLQKLRMRKIDQRLDDP